MNETTLKTGFGKCFRDAREVRKLSRAALGLRLGISPKTIQSWEMGRTFPEDLSLIPAIEQELGVSFSDMISASMEQVPSWTARESDPGYGMRPHRRLDRAVAGPLSVTFNITSQDAADIETSDYVAVPLLKPSSAEKPVSELQEDDIIKNVLFPAEWITRGRLLVSFRMKDSAMEPHIPHGASILVDTRQTVPEKLYGQIVAFWIPDKGLRIRRMAVNPDGTPAGLPGREGGRGKLELNFQGGDRVLGVVIGFMAAFE